MPTLGCAVTKAKTFYFTTLAKQNNLYPKSKRDTKYFLNKN